MEKNAVQGMSWVTRSRRWAGEQQDRGGQAERKLSVAHSGILLSF